MAVASRVISIALVILRHVKRHIWRYVVLVGLFLAVVNLVARFWPSSAAQEISYRLISRSSQVIDTSRNPSIIILTQIQDGPGDPNSATFSFDGKNSHWWRGDIRVFEVQITNTGKEPLWFACDSRPSLVNVAGPFRLVTKPAVTIIYPWLPDMCDPDLGLKVTNGRGQDEGGSPGWDDGAVALCWRCWPPGKSVVLRVTYLSSGPDGEEFDVSLEGRLAKNLETVCLPPLYEGMTASERRLRSVVRWLGGLSAALGFLLFSGWRVRLAFRTRRFDSKNFKPDPLLLYLHRESGWHLLIACAILVGIVVYLTTNS
jgi:hypothetical protein